MLLAGVIVAIATTVPQHAAGRRRVIVAVALAIRVASSSCRHHIDHACRAVVGAASGSGGRCRGTGGLLLLSSCWWLTTLAVEVVMVVCVVALVVVVSVIGCGHCGHRHREWPWWLVSSLVAMVAVACRRIDGG